MGHGVAPEERDRLTARRSELEAQYVKPRDQRPASTARGVHHAAHICSDVERTVQFYDGINDNCIFRIDVLFGWAATYPELAVQYRTLT